jgi:hypothetical protein
MRLPPFLLAAAGAAVILAPAMALVPGIASSPRVPAFFPHGDHAVLEIYTRLAASGDQRLGPYSRFHFHHPGPALFYLSLPVYEATGESHEGLKLAALLFNCLSVLGLLWLAQRLAGLGGYLATALGLAAFVTWWGPAGLLSNWNPTVAVLPFGLALLAWGGVAAGQIILLPLAVFASSFAVQTHVGCAPVTLALATTSLAIAALSPLRRVLHLPPVGPRAWLGPGLAACIVAGVLWALPVAEELDPAGGNLSRILEISRQVPSRHPSWSDAVRALSENAAPFLMGSDPTPAGSRTLFAVLAGGLAAAILFARRAGSAIGVALSMVTLTGMSAAVYSTTRIPGWAQPYLVGWMSMLGLCALIAATIGLATAPRLRHPRLGRLASIASVAVVVLLSGLATRAALKARDSPGPPDALSEWIRMLAEPSVPALRASGVRRFLVEVERPVPRAVAVGLLLALDKAGVPFAVSPFGPFRFEGRMAPNGTEDAVLSVGGESSAWTDQEGASMLAREGGVFLYLLPGGLEGQR